MRMLPVLDLLDGVVVRAVGGRRDEYRPIDSVLTSNTDALSVARAVRDRLGLNRFYLADLDSILYGHPNVSVYRRLADEGFELLIDPGVRSADMVQAMFDSGAHGVIAALETSSGPQSLREFCERFGSDRILFSLDMQSGHALGDLRPWNASATPDAIADQAIDAGITRIIVLDLVQVGTHSGPSTLPFCRQLRSRYPDLEITTGGGVRGMRDLAALHAANVTGVLIASALHDGSIGREEIEQIRRATDSEACRET